MKMAILNFSVMMMMMMMKKVVDENVKNFP